MKHTLKKLFSRFSFVTLTIIFLFLAFVAMIVGIIYLAQAVVVHYYPDMSWVVYGTLIVLDWLVLFIAILHCANRDHIPETKLPWLLTIAMLNVLGVAIYIVFSHNRPTKKQRALYSTLRQNARPLEISPFTKEERREKIGSWIDVSDSLMAVNPSALVFANTKTEYFPSGEQFATRFLNDLEKAKKYIFIEYFIIAKGQFWSAVLSVLERKVKEGVEVRLMYDDIGSMGRVHVNYHKTLRKKGIACQKFNHFVPVLSNVHNNRDHRKIVVIDGAIGYTGGLNLADEYVNLTHPYGHWKDTAIRLEGEGVKNFIVMFLKLYNFNRRTVEDFSPYLGGEYQTFENEGYVQPYGDGPRPLYGTHTGEDVYINLLNGAQKYAYIMTPYLIIDYNMRETLVLAARRGVDVRIITPHIPDKKVPYALTRANYLALIKGGVKIYEYTPGFIHAKSMLVDDEVGVVGTINLDYRSFIHHFEDAVLLYGTKSLLSLKEDFKACFEISKLQSQEDAKKSVLWRGLCKFAAIFAPMF